METIPSFRHLSNVDLNAAVLRFAQDERRMTALLIAALAEFERRRLYLDCGFNSLYAYCIQVLHLSEHAAYGRIEAARAARKFRCVLVLLQDGSLSLTNLGLLARHLTEANQAALLKEAAHKRKEDVQRIVARLNPQPDAPSVIRKLPAPKPAEQVSNAPIPVETGPNQLEPASTLVAIAATPISFQKPAVLAPLAPERYKIQITVDQETREVLRQAQDLMRHSNPSGDPAVVIARALRVLVEDLLKKKAALTDQPRASRPQIDGSRAIPAAVKREVWKRDGGHCTFEGARGRCDGRSPLEYHHMIPYAMGGQATADNIELRCRAHNVYQASLDGLGSGSGRGNEKSP